MKAIESTLTILAADGTQRDLLDLMQTRQELYDLLEYDSYEERDREYFSNEDAGCRGQAINECLVADPASCILALALDSQL